MPSFSAAFSQMQTDYYGQWWASEAGGPAHRWRPGV